MNDKYSTTEGKTSEKLSDEAMLSAQWKNIDWHKAEQEVNRLQIRIVKATQQKDYNAVKRLQYLLTHSFYAKALAVKRVVTNDGRRTPGVDGVLWNTPAKKMAAALSLTDKRYRARPLRRVYIEKKDKKKKRPLGIPTMYDRAMQALYALALEPVAETTADGKSFGFRKGRCAQDACEYLFNALSRKHISPKWVLEGDIKGCFDHISHDWLLANIPMDSTAIVRHTKIKATANPFLDADYIRKRKFDKGMRRLTGKFKTIWKNQNGLCYHCGMPMAVTEEREIIYLAPKSKTDMENVRNMRYVHCSCQRIYAENRLKK